jgi:hypothetical protein
MNLVFMQFFKPLVSTFESKKGHVSAWVTTIRGLILFHVLCYPYFVRQFIHRAACIVSSKLRLGRASKFTYALGTEMS